MSNTLSDYAPRTINNRANEGILWYQSKGTHKSLSNEKTYPLYDIAGVVQRSHAWWIVSLLVAGGVVAAAFLHHGWLALLLSLPVAYALTGITNRILYKKFFIVDTYALLATEGDNTVGDPQHLDTFFLANRALARSDGEILMPYYWLPWETPLFPTYVLSSKNLHFHVSDVLYDAVKEYLHTLQDEKPDQELMFNLSAFVRQSSVVVAACHKAEKLGLKSHEITDLEVARIECDEQAQRMLSAFKRATRDFAYIHEERRKNEVIDILQQIA